MSTRFNDVQRTGRLSEIPAESVVSQFHGPPEDAVSDPAAAVVASLGDPLDFPPLRQAVVQGDRVAVVLDHDVPQAPDIVGGTIETLISCGVDPQDVVIVQTDAARRHVDPDPRGSLPADIGRRVQREIHDPLDRDRLAYLGLTRANEPLYLNRTLVDADFVLPILRARPGTGPLAGGQSPSGLFPSFSDRTSSVAGRLVPSPDLMHGDAAAQIDEAGWMLGIRLAVRVVPAVQSGVLSILAGDAPAVFRAGQIACENAWSWTVPDRVPLVVACIDGPRGEHTWETVAHVLSIAGAAAQDGGGVLVVSELETPPGMALSRLGTAEDAAQLLPELRKDPSPDGVTALEMARALARGPVYLRSRLDAESVEELNIVPLTSDTQIARLVARYASCIILGNAQHIVLQDGNTR